jgi:hypothetical protein
VPGIEPGPPDPKPGTLTKNHHNNNEECITHNLEKQAEKGTREKQKKKT